MKKLTHEQMSAIAKLLQAESEVEKHSKQAAEAMRDGSTTMYEWHSKCQREAWIERQAIMKSLGYATFS